MFGVLSIFADQLIKTAVFWSRTFARGSYAQQIFKRFTKIKIN